MSSKKTILIFIDWFLPAYKAGGPIQSVNNIVQRLCNEFEIYIVTSDRDLGEKQSFVNIQLNQWLDKRDYKIIYVSPKNLNIPYFISLLKLIKPNQVYLNSLLSISFSLKPLIASIFLNLDILLAPRGMLGLGSLQIKSKKKKLFLFLFKAFKIPKKITFHATSEDEKNDIVKHFGTGLKIKIASNLPAIIPSYLIKEKEANILNVFFLSRINEIKNLIDALFYLSKVDSGMKITFTIYGAIDGEGYWQECQEKIEKLPENITCIYEGSIPHIQLRDKLASQHLLLLPTRNENFGHAIMEAWQNSCLVLISDQTPWKELESKSIGWEFPLNQKDKFVQAIELVCSLNQEQFEHYSKAAHDFAFSFSENPELVEASKKLFE